MRKSFHVTAVAALVLGWAVVASAGQSGVQGLRLSANRVEAGETVSATATGNGPCGAVHIDWGDGTAITYATETLPVTQTHVYKYGGTFNLRAEGMGGCTGEARARIEVTGPPPPPPALARIRLSETSIEPRSAVSITIEGDSGCRVGLDFGDGNTQQIAEQLPATVRHTYTMPGRYTIVATPREPCTERQTATIEVAPREEQQITGISVDVPPQTAATVRAITVHGTGRCSYVLNYGDGNSERRDRELPDVVRHNYPAPGRYTIVATAERPCQGSLQWTFTVEGSPARNDLNGRIRGVTVRPQAVVTGQTVTIEVAGSGTCRFGVDFHDGQSQTFTERLPHRLTYRYSQPGDYTIVAWSHEPCIGEGDALVQVRRRE